MHFKAYFLHIFFDESLIKTNFVYRLLHLNLHPSNYLLIDIKKLLHVIHVHELILLLLYSFSLKIASLLNLYLVGCASSTCGIKLFFFVLILACTVIVDIQPVGWVDEMIVVPFLTLKHDFFCVVSMLLFFL